VPQSYRIPAGEPLAAGQWAAAPQAPVGCPPGLEYLTQIDQILAHQVVELLEAFTGWQTQVRACFAILTQHALAEQVRHQELDGPADLLRVRGHGLMHANVLRKSERLHDSHRQQLQSGTVLRALLYTRTL